uniref:Putative secreted protein n=1 Tax=Anopheles marajoara TaxID=58244 RepID=A0A2M4C718_9DIPT
MFLLSVRLFFRITPLLLAGLTVLARSFTLRWYVEAFRQFRALQDAWLSGGRYGDCRFRFLAQVLFADVNRFEFVGQRDHFQIHHRQRCKVTGFLRKCHHLGQYVRIRFLHAQAVRKDGQGLQLPIVPDLVQHALHRVAVFGYRL